VGCTSQGVQRHVLGLGLGVTYKAVTVVTYVPVIGLGHGAACAQDPTRRPGRLIVIELRPCNRTDDFVVLIASRVLAGMQ
jgi:hypothetical protein